MMNIKSFLAISATILVLDAGVAVADELDEAADIGEARLLLQAGREEIIREEMRLNAAEDPLFWPVYDSYQRELMVIRNRYAVLLSDYIEAYRSGTVSAEFAEKLVDEFLDIQGDVLKVKKKHLKHFRKVLPARKAARFYQLENKMDAELEGQLALFVPLIDPV